MDGIPFHIRDARQDDLAHADALAYAEGMGTIESVENVRVAVNDVDEVIGFLRLVFDEGNVAHVNPVVIHPSWRGRGVGRALVEDAAARAGELRLVSRGTSLAFYRALGFVDLPWSAIEPDIVAECDGCELYDVCGPVPMGRSAPTQEV